MEEKIDNNIEKNIITYVQKDNEVQPIVVLLNFIAFLVGILNPIFGIIIAVPAAYKAFTNKSKLGKVTSIILIIFLIVSIIYVVISVMKDATIEFK